MNIRKRGIDVVIAESMHNNYETKITNEREIVFSDTTTDKGGSGEHFRPHDYLCTAYAACLNMTTRMIMNDMNICYEKITVKVELDRSKKGKTVFLYNIDIEGDISQKMKEKILKLVSNCPVRKTLSSEISFKMME